MSTIDIPRERFNSTSSDRICAHAARQFVRILAHPSLGVGHVNLIQQPQRAARGIPRRNSRVADERLCNLVADANVRRQRGHGILEHQANPRTPDPIQVNLGHANEIERAQACMTGCTAVGWQKSQGRQKCLAFASSRLPHHSQAFPRGDRKRETPHRMHITCGS
jgi:hypothetical protein